MHQHHHCRILASTLDVIEVRTADTGALGEFGLRQPRLQAVIADGLCKVW